jgi:hypothetical protein
VSIKQIMDTEEGEGKQVYWGRHVDRNTGIRMSERPKRQDKEKYDAPDL